MARLRSTALAGLLAGVLAAALALGPAPRARPGAVSAWVADRDGDRVVGLDRELRSLEALAVPAPRFLAPSEAGLWIVAATGLRPAGAHAAFLRRDGALARVGALEAVRAAAGAGEGLLVLEGGGAGAPGRLVHLAPDGARTLLVSGTDAGLLVSDGEREVALGSADGATECFRLVGGRAVLRARARFRAPLVALARAPDGDAWWVLDDGGRRVVATDGRLRVRWSRGTGVRATLLAPAAGRATVWLADPEAAELLELGRDVRAAVARPDRAPTALAPAADGGLLLALPGAVLALDAAGASRASQGGFGYLVAAAAAR